MNFDDDRPYSPHDVPFLWDALNHCFRTEAELQASRDTMAIELLECGWPNALINQAVFGAAWVPND